MGPQVETFSSPGEMTERAAHLVVAAGEHALRERGHFHLVLAGGSTPLPLYARLAEPPWSTALDWRRVHFWWGDERCVEPDHPDSNFGGAWEAWLSTLTPPPSHLHRMRGELDPEKAAHLYAEEIARFLDARRVGFDLVLLGMGADGHTASLFPGRPEAADPSRPVVVAHSPEPPHLRISLGLRTLNAAAHVLFLVRGEAKRTALRSVLGGRSSLPAARIRPQGTLTWLVETLVPIGK